MNKTVIQRLSLFNFITIVISFLGISFCFAAAKPSSLHHLSSASRSGEKTDQKPPKALFSKFFRHKSLITESEFPFRMTMELLNPEEVTRIFFRSIEKIKIPEDDSQQAHPALPPLKKTQIDPSNPYIGGFELQYLKEFDSLLTPYLAEKLSISPSSLGPPSPIKTSYLHGLFHTIRSHFTELSPFFFADMRQTLQLLIEETTHSSLSEYAPYYYTYAQIMKTALSIWAAQIQKEQILLDQPKFCAEFKAYFKHSFNLTQIFLDQNSFNALELRLTQIEKNLSKIKLRYPLFPQSSHESYFLTVRKLELEALRVYHDLSTRFSITLDPQLASRCLPQVYQLIQETQLLEYDSKTKKPAQSKELRLGLNSTRTNQNDSL